MRLIPGLLLSLEALSLSGCLYGFSGGGLPPAIKTVAVIPFENLTSEPALTQEINRAVREAVESRLGLRQAGENQADAIVRGTIQRYEPDVPIAFTGDQNRGADVTRRKVLITVNVQIFDQKAQKVLWERQGLTVEGDYDRTQEIQGRQKALLRLITDIVDGAQSQW